MQNIREKIKPTLNKFLSFFLLIAISLSIIWIASAAAPNPGHTISEIGNVEQGDILYGSATDVILALAKSPTATRYLSNTGATNNPAWAKVVLTDGVSGILPTANGGTGIAFFTAAGPTVARTYTFPDAAATVLTSNAAVTVAQGGTGLGTLTLGNVILGAGTNNVTFVAPGTSGNVLTSNGSTWTSVAPSGGSNYRTLVTLGSDVTNNNATANTLANCTGLSFAVTSGTRYRFYALIWYTSAAGTTGSRWTINGPTATNMAYQSTYTLTVTSMTTNFATAYSIPAASNVTSLTAGNIAILQGTILPSANGTVVVRFASEVANSAIVCKAGSTLEWW